YIVAPEWRYFGEQTRKAERLAELGAAVDMPVWPADFAGWQSILGQARALDISRLSELYAADAARRAAQWLERCVDRLWEGTTTGPPANEATESFPDRVTSLDDRRSVASEKYQP
ncbi:MAG: hypothetical protein VX950_11235, partial [Pseudomonadota bacterium]|nr:hypothetical protein [Pseudomonadota bacterium]